MTSEGCKKCPYLDTNEANPECALGKPFSVLGTVYHPAPPSFSGKNPEHCVKIRALNKGWPPNIAHELNPNKRIK